MMIFEKKQVEKLIHKMKAMELPYTKLLFEEIESLDAVKHDTMEHHRDIPGDVSWQSIQAGDQWGGPFHSMWLKAAFTVPEHAQGRKLVLYSQVDAHECLAFINGQPVGLFNKDGDESGANHSIVLMTPDAVVGQFYDIALECYAGTPCLGCFPYENYGYKKMPEEQYIRTYQGVKVAAIREDVAEFLFDLKTVNQMATVLDAASLRRGQALSTLMDVYQVVCQFPTDVPESTWKAQMLEAQQILKTFLAVPNGPSAGNVGLIGHSHMDSAWLWTVEETKRKCARTYANALALMEWYPEYTFIQSSALHGAWMKELYPSIFDDMKRRVAEGRYEPNGAVWVECDCNVTGGESMVRQFLWGQKFTEKEFGYQSDAFWLPDTFGYNAAIPQIMQKSGVKYFLTTKMEWNESNKFPYDSFTWKGSDGTPVLVHLNRTHVWPDAQTSIKNFNALPDKHVSPAKLVSYGFGDGGGGPQYQMVEMSRRIGDLNGCPPSKHTTVSQFMNELEQVQEQLPVWNGELYLELHRGTLTMMHGIKRSNRKAEMALREYEALSVAAQIYAKKPINAEQLRTWWSVILLNQFHDILPGTCIPEVYDIAIPENYCVVDEAHRGAQQVLSELTKAGNAVTVYNSLNWTRKGQIMLDVSDDIEHVATQRIVNTYGQERLAVQAELPPMAATTYTLTSSKDQVNTSSFSYQNDCLETPFATIQFDEQGGIISYVDKSTGRQLRRASGAPMNTLYFGEDVPNAWDNWDIDPDIDMKLQPHMRLQSRHVVADGPLQLRIESVYAIGETSSLKQQMIVYSDTARVDFETQVDWQEKHRLLKVGFDVDVLSPMLRSEMQFGYIDRPTFNNTSWDAAKSEVCNHKWSDLSESRFGVAVLNDCKYGISCRESDMRLSLLKGGCRPDPRGDAGVHQLTYSLLPHDGGFSSEAVVRPAYELNVDPMMTSGESINDGSLFTLNCDHVIVESVKPAECGEGYIIRLYECERSAVQNTVLQLGHKADRIFQTNMLEEVECELNMQDGGVNISFKPFEIKTLWVK